MIQGVCGVQDMTGRYEYDNEGIGDGELKGGIEAQANKQTNTTE